METVSSICNLFIYFLGTAHIIKKLSRGCLIVFAGQSINTSLLNAYLDSLGSTFSNGANFAVAGSATLPKYEAFSLNIQVLQFLHFKTRSAELAAAGYLSHYKSLISQLLKLSMVFPPGLGSSEVGDVDCIGK